MAVLWCDLVLENKVTEQGGRSVLSPSPRNVSEKLVPLDSENSGEFDHSFT